MNKEEAQSWLKTLACMHERVRNVEEELRRIKSRAERITPSYSPNIGGQSGFNTHSKVEEGAILYIKTMEKLEQICSEFDDRRVRFLNITMQMDGVEAHVLERRYMSGQSWKYITRQMRYTEDGIFAIHRRAVDSFAKKFSETYEQ